MDDELVRTLLDFKLRLSGEGWATLSLLLGNAVREIKRLDSENQRLAAEVEWLTPKAMTWSDDCPSEIGMYVFRLKGRTLLEGAFNVEPDDLGCFNKDMWAKCEFVGPYPTAVEPKGAP